MTLPLLCGALNLSVLGEASHLLKAERRVGVQRDAAQTQALVLSLEGKSRREAEKFIMDQAGPDVARQLQKQQERLRPLGKDMSRMTLVITADQEAKIAKLKGLLSHRNVQGGTMGLLDLLLDEALENHDPARRATRVTAKEEKKKVQQTAPATLLRQANEKQMKQSGTATATSLRPSDVPCGCGTRGAVPRRTAAAPTICIRPRSALRPRWRSHRGKPAPSLCYPQPPRG